MRRHSPVFIASLLVVAILLFIAGSVWLDAGGLARLLRRTAPSPVPAPAATPAPTPPPFVEMELIPAARDPAAGIRFLGNGREEMHLVARNSTGREIRTEIPRGMLFTTADGAVQVVVTHSVPVVIPREGPASVRARTAAIRLSNTLGDQQFYPSEARIDQLDRFLPLLEQFPDASAETVQTAVLILLHNPPLPVFARFKLVEAEQAAGPFAPDIFRVDLHDILLAMLLLKDFPGAPQPPRIATSSQLKLEALINPRTHDLAMRYYDITREAEWDFWRSELTSGNPATRHYALYGIARYYPDVAFRMLPAWVSEPRTPAAYRAAAAYALAEIENDAALRTLSELQARLASDQAVAQPLARAVEIARRRAAERARTGGASGGATPEP